MCTTRPDRQAGRHPDLVDRQFTAQHPNQLWVTDLTYVPTWAGVAYVCFIVDAFSRMVVGWRVATHMRTEMVLDALEMARWKRSTRLEGPAGVPLGRRQPVHLYPLRGTPRRDRRDPVDRIDRGLLRQCARREAVNSLYKTELIRHHGPRPGIDDVELATLGWVHWFNNERLHDTLGDIPPIEFESVYYQQVGSNRPGWNPMK